MWKASGQRTTVDQRVGPFGQCGGLLGRRLGEIFNPTASTTAVGIVKERQAGRNESRPTPTDAESSQVGSSLRKEKATNAACRCAASLSLVHPPPTMPEDPDRRCIRMEMCQWMHCRLQ